LFAEVTSAMSKLVRKYLVADAYYSCQSLIDSLLASGDDIVSRVKWNVVAYKLPEPVGDRKRGRPAKYGDKIKLRDLFSRSTQFSRGKIIGYAQEEVEVEYYSLDLLWKPVGRVIRFVLVRYPGKGRAIFISTDLKLDPLTVIALYAMRFKIEVSFKQAVHTIGTFAYHFWLKSMKRIKRCSGNQYLHRTSEDFRRSVHMKLEAYHKFVITGLVAQGLMQYLSSYFPGDVYDCSPWLRTYTTSGHPSEETVAAALRMALPEFLHSTATHHPLAKFLTKLRRRDRANSLGMAA
jgi:hypothetical protein